jgi:hypothetical protein
MSCFRFSISLAGVITVLNPASALFGRNLHTHRVIRLR